MYHWCIYNYHTSSLLPSTVQKSHFITAKGLLYHCAKESLTLHCHHHHDWLIHHCQQLVTASSQHHVAAKLHNYLCQLLCHINLNNLICCCLNNLPYCCQFMLVNLYWLDHISTVDATTSFTQYVKRSSSIEDHYHIKVSSQGLFVSSCTLLCTVDMPLYIVHHWTCNYVLDPMNFELAPYIQNSTRLGLCVNYTNDATLDDGCVL